MVKGDGQMEELWYLCDTNVFLENLDVLNDKNIVVVSHIYRELDNHKSPRNSNQDLRYQARRAVRWIRANKDRIKRDLKDYKWNLNTEFDGNYVDNLLIQACVESGYGIITGDQLLAEKAEGYRIPCIFVDENASTGMTSYSGIKEIHVSSDEELAEMYESVEKLGLLTNQYLIVHSDHIQKVDCLRWTGKALVELDLPPKRVVEAQNYHQECALDLLYNTKIPIKIIAGTYGAGKTFLTVKVGLEFVNGKNSRKHYGKMMMVRNPIGSGEMIGFLKGTKEDKTEDFFKPIVQHLNGGEFELAQMEHQGKLIKEIPFYMKGLSIDDTFIIVDEAEDLNKKLIKLIGTRLGKNACVVFSGDFNQAEDKYAYNNGLYIAIEKLKGNPLVGIVVLPEDVRSEASKVFAEL
jgi:PhoH-like ATPase